MRSLRAMRGGGTGSSKRRLLACGAGTVVLLALLAQVILPRIAASRISSRIGRYGAVQSVSVSAWPAIKLLWGDADSVRVSARSLALTTRQAAALLWEARGTSSLDISAREVRLGPLRVHDATLRKRGSALTATALADEADVRAALPGGLAVQLLRSAGGEVEVRASGALFGIGASVDAVALASEGKLVAHPVGFLVEALQLTLFADQHVHVSGVAATVASDRPRVYRLALTGILH